MGSISTVSSRVLASLRAPLKVEEADLEGFRLVGEVVDRGAAFSCVFWFLTGSTDNVGSLPKVLFCCPCPPGTLAELSLEDCEVCELCRLTTIGLFFLEAEATNFLLAGAGINFLSTFSFSIFSSIGAACSRIGEGDCTTPLFVLVLPDSSSEAGGDMNRAVGRGPFAEGPRVFFNIGGGIGAGARGTDVSVVLDRLSLRTRATEVVEAVFPM